MDDVSRELRRQCLLVSHASGHGHLPTCFSIIEMLRALYAVMRHDPGQPDAPWRDIFILSKGHAALAHYVVLAQQKYFSFESLSSFGGFASRFGCHADRLKVPGVEWSTGSLGHGLSAALGFALGIKLKGEERRVFVLIGDGESNEGSIWEALQVAAARQLNNLVLMLDLNQSQSRCLPLLQPEQKFVSMGWQVQTLDGHNMGELTSALQAPRPALSPLALICHTGKGYGCASMLNDMFAWHRRSPNAEELQQLMRELDNA